MSVFTYIIYQIKPQANVGGNFLRDFSVKKLYNI